MDSLLTYFFQVNMVWLMMWLLYVLLRGVTDTFFSLRRWLLLAMGVFAFLFPLLATLWPDRLSDSTDWATGVAWLPVVSVTPGAGDTAGLAWWVVVYIMITAVLLVRMGSGLLSVVRHVRRCPEARCGGQRYFLLPEGTVPFSFFGRIYLPEQLERSPYMKAVLAHEAVHARQFHSVDLLFMQTACALLWCNPAVWMMWHEIRILHEYLADEGAAGQGDTCRRYQLALLTFSTAGLSPFTLVATPPINKFNVLPLKNRIKMMKTRRTSRFWRMKYLLVLPAGLYMLALAHPAHADRALAEPSAAVSEKSVVTDEDIPDNATVEQKAVYEGGEIEMLKKLSANIQYPADAQEKNVQGHVLVTFVVDKDGRVKDAKVKKSLFPSCDKAALDAVRKLGRFQPARQGGRTVAVRMMLPVAFRLQ